jgi:hypothetical protein
MLQSQSARVVQQIEHGSRYDSRVIGDRAFIRRALAEAAHYQPAATREQLLNAVAGMFGTTPDNILTKTLNERRATQARALVAWQAMRNGMSPSEIARWLGRTWPTLLVGIERHRRKNAAAFDASFESLLAPGK